MLPEDSKTADEADIRDVIDGFTKAVRAKNVEAMLSYCASDLATFDMVPPLKHEGTAAVRGLWTRTLAGFEGPVECDVHQLEIMVGGDVAYCRSLNRFGGTRKDGKRSVSWLCSTLGLRKESGRWKIAHEHVSVPFDMETGQAMLALKP